MERMDICIIDRWTGMLEEVSGHCVYELRWRGKRVDGGGEASTTEVVKR